MKFNEALKTGLEGVNTSLLEKAPAPLIGYVRLGTSGQGFKRLETREPSTTGPPSLDLFASVAAASREGIAVFAPDRDALSRVRQA
jgi:hypothetical protein